MEVTKVISGETRVDYIIPLDNDTILTASRELNQVHTMSLSTEQSVEYKDASVCNPTECLVVSKYGIIAAGNKNNVLLWKLEDANNPMLELYTTRVGTYSVTFNPTGKLLATLDASGFICIWKMDNLSPSNPWLGWKDNTMSSLIFTAEDVILTAHENGSLKAFKIEEGDIYIPFNTFQFHDMEITSLVISHDGKYVASMAPFEKKQKRDKIVVFTSDTFEIISEIQVDHTESMTYLAFSVTLGLIAAAGEKTVIIWDIANIKEIVRYALPACISSIAFNTEGKFIIGDVDGKIYLMSLDEEQQQAAKKQRVQEG